jgi:argininosuccinate lyase
MRCKARFEANGSYWQELQRRSAPNPGDARTMASDVVASVQNVVLRAHNVTPGMIDCKYGWTDTRARTFVLGSQMLRDATDVMASLRVDPKRSLEELESEWTTSRELAETLQRENRIAFRVGHHFASEVVLYAREHGLGPKDFPYAEAVRIYAEAAKIYPLVDSRWPLDEVTFRRTLSPEAMVRTRVGIGGPQRKRHYVGSLFIAARAASTSANIAGESRVPESGPISFIRHTVTLTRENYQAWLR